MYNPSREQLILPIEELQAIVGPANVIYRPEDLLVYEYDGTIDRVDGETL